MEHEKVESSMIASIGYEQAELTLEVTFLNGKIYQYYQVKPEIYEQFMGASSKGHFMNDHIIGVYEYARKK